MATASRIVAATCGLTFAFAGLSTGPALADHEDDPAGNNGVIKVDQIPFDSTPGNEPHTGCTFQIDFFNYDEGDYFADVTFELRPPTSGAGYSLTVDGDTRPFIGEDSAGGGTDVDAQETYTLSFTGTPQPQRGYHVRLTVEAPRSLGADTKQKTYYVMCDATATTLPPTAIVGGVAGEAPTNEASTGSTSAPPSRIILAQVVAGAGLLLVLMWGLVRWRSHGQV